MRLPDDPKYPQISSKVEAKDCAELLLSQPPTKFFERQGGDGILRLVVLILGRVKFGQHALMQDSRN